MDTHIPESIAVTSSLDGAQEQSLKKEKSRWSSCFVDKRETEKQIQGMLISYQTGKAWSFLHVLSIWNVLYHKIILYIPSLSLGASANIILSEIFSPTTLPCFVLQRLCKELLYGAFICFMFIFLFELCLFCSQLFVQQQDQILKYSRSLKNINSMKIKEVQYFIWERYKSAVFFIN